MEKLIEALKKKLKQKRIQFEKIEFLAGDASNRKYFKIYQAGEKKILMFDDDKKNIKSFIRITEILNKEVSVPKIYKELPSDDILILEYFGKTKFSQLINISNRKKLYTIALDALIHLHKKKFTPKIPYYKKQDFLNESNLFFEWYLPFKKKKMEKNLIKEFERVFSSFLDNALSIQKVFIHRDYHVDNLFFLKNREKHLRCGWIDYQDALIGPCVYDLVSLTQDARINVDRNLEDYLINYYLKNFPELKKKEFLFSLSVIAIQRHLKVLGIFSRLYLRDKKKNYTKHIPRVKRLLKKNLEKKEFFDLKKIFKSLI